MHNLLFLVNFVSYLLCWCHPEIFGFHEEHCFLSLVPLGELLMGHTQQTSLTGGCWTGLVLRIESAEWRAETEEAVAVLLEQLASCSGGCWTGLALRIESAEWRAETEESVAVLLEQWTSCSRVCLT